MAGSQRQQRVSEQVKEVITEILPSMRDPRLGFVTITGVEVTQDLSHARVFFSAYGTTEEQEKSLQALQKGAGFVRRGLARRIQLRHTPELEFRLDTTPERADRIMKLLHTIEIEDAERAAATGHSTSSSTSDLQTEDTRKTTGDSPAES